MFFTNKLVKHSPPSFFLANKIFSQVTSDAEVEIKSLHEALISVSQLIK